MNSLLCRIMQMPIRIQNVYSKLPEESACLLLGDDCDSERCGSCGLGWIFTLALSTWFTLAGSVFIVTPPGSSVLATRLSTAFPISDLMLTTVKKIITNTHTTIISSESGILNWISKLILKIWSKLFIIPTTVYYQKPATAAGFCNVLK